MFCPRQLKKERRRSRHKDTAGKQKICAWPDQQPGCGTDRVAQADQAGMG
jgi:hypothetical protein